MTMKKWRLLLAAEIMLAGGTLDEATAQQKLPVAPPTVCASCTKPAFPLWNRCKDRLDRWFVHDTTDVVPLGQSVYQTMTNQVESGIAARMILNDFDFEPNGVNLNVRGKDKLPRLVAQAMQYPYFITIERTSYDPALAEQRRQALVKELARLAIPLSPDRIVVGGSPAPGLNGVEAELIYQGLLNQTISGGTNLGIGVWRGNMPSGGGMQQPMSR
jgi:hypothetical protein